MTTDEIRRKLASTPQADWIREMREEYARTGSYPPEALRRLLGDPTRRVDMPLRGTVSRHFTQVKKQAE